MTTFKIKSIPLYYQLENILREKITSGEYIPNRLLPTEKQLADFYKVSRVTVRQALSALEKDSLIVRKRGVGSYVCETKNEIEEMKLSGTIEEVIAAGIKTTIKVIEFGFTRPQGQIMNIFDLDSDSKILKIEHLRFHKEKPYSYAVNYIPADLGKKIQITDITIGDALYNILERKCNIEVKHANMVMEATVADAKVASLLGIMMGAPLLKMRRTVFDKKDRPVNHVRVQYRADMYHYTAKLVRDRGLPVSRWKHSNA